MMKLISFLGSVWAAVLIGLASFSANAAEIVVGQVAPFSGPLAPTGTVTCVPAPSCTSTP
jgi:hypothetical protein